MARAKPNKKSNVVSVDFEGVETYTLIPEGDYFVKAAEVTKEEGNEHPYLAWVYEISRGDMTGKKLYENTSLSPQALWRLRSLLEAAGQEVPDGALDIDLDSICGDMEEFCVTVEHEKYDGKNKARVVDCFVADGSEADEDDGKSKKSAAKGKKEEPEEPEIDLDAIDDMDEDELEELIDEHDLDVDLDDYKKLKDKRAAVKEAAEAAGDEPEEKKKPAGKDKKKSYDEDAIKEMGTKELQAVVDEAELDVELEGSTSTKRRAVLKALKAAGLIEA